MSQNTPVIGGISWNMLNIYVERKKGTLQC